MSNQHKQPRAAQEAKGLPPVAALSAEEIALRVQRGGPLAAWYFAELVERYQARLFNFLARRAGRQSAEDLTQESFVRAWEQIARYNPTWRFSTWLFTIGARLAITQHRRSRRTLGSAAMELTQAKAVYDGRSDLGARLWALAGSHLSADQHTALWLRYAEDMSIGDIARVMDKSEVGVRVCLFRSRQALAKLVGADVARDLNKVMGDVEGPEAVEPLVVEVPHGKLAGARPEISGGVS
ncbi:MAG: sigma-70 family RNA polymerase sigma factor [Phycisphaerales bacterium]|jgi:RNA polymerase sigma-70 factor (ECF subfamily)